jgi:hypothetical protein
MNLPAGLLSGDAETFGEEDEDETEESDAI